MSRDVLRNDTAMILHLSINSSLILLVMLTLGCGQAPQAESKLRHFWQYRPTNRNPLEVAGYDRSFAETAPPTIVDAMIEDLKSHESSERFETYALVAYYAPRSSIMDRLTKLRQSSTDATRRCADRFLQRLRELDSTRQKSDSQL